MLAREEVPRFGHEARHAAPSLRNRVAPKVAAHALYLGLVNGAHTTKNGMTKIPLR